jgi:hypothetical protein
MNNEFELDSLLKRMADSHQAELPSPGLIWWRAQVQRKQKEKERIERPLMIMRGVAAAACGAAFLVFLVSSWGQLELTLAPRLLVPLAITVLVAFVGLAFLGAGPAVGKTSGGS